MQKWILNYRSVVVGEIGAVPPVFVEHTIGEAHHFGKSVQPTVQEGIERNQQEKRAWQGAVQ